MSALRTRIVIGAAALVLAAGPALAQTPAAQQPPAGQQQPPAGQQQTPPATPQQKPVQPPPATPQPPKPFPEGAKVAYVNIQMIASNSVEGKAASAKIQELQKKKQGELGQKQKALQDMQTKLQQGGSVLNDQARGQLENDIEKAQLHMLFSIADSGAIWANTGLDLSAEVIKRFDASSKAPEAEKK